MIKLPMSLFPLLTAAMTSKMPARTSAIVTLAMVALLHRNTVVDTIKAMVNLKVRKNETKKII